MPSLTAALSGELPVFASGTATLSMIVNLKRFVRRNNGTDTDYFEQIRGTEAFARYLDALPAQMKPPFVLDTEEQALIEAAHQLRIFRGFVLSEFLFPTYRLDEEAFLEMPNRLTGDQVLVETFPQWDYQVTLTRNGFAVVRMIRHFDDILLSTIAAEIQQVQQAGDVDTMYRESRSSWRIAMDVTATLLESLGDVIELDIAHGDHARIVFDSQMRRGRLPLHDRYLMIHLDHIHRGGQVITTDELTTKYASFALGMMRLATVLRGGAAHDMRHRRQVKSDGLLNLSPWMEDMCLATNDAMLIYTPPVIDFEDADDQADHYTHHQYWQGIVRGAEWLVALRTELQLVERQSTELLASVSNLTARVSDGILSEEDQTQLKALAKGVSLAFNIIPQLRYALVPSSISHSTDAVYIFSHLMKQLGQHQVSTHVNTNMNELSAFLGYYSSTQLQYESRIQEESESRTGLTISIMLILLSLVTVPSLIKDASEIDWNTLARRPLIEQGVIIVLAGLPLVLLILTAWYAYRSLRK